MTAFFLDVFFPFIVPVVMGLVAIVWRSQLADLAVRWNWRLLGLRFRTGYYEAGFLFGGLGLILITVLTFLGVVS